MYGGIKMKRILIALFTIFACGKTFAEPVGGFIPPIPPIYAHPDVVEYAIKKYVVAPYDTNKVTAAYEQYMNQNDGTITLENLQQKVCPAGGMDKTRCKEFTDALMIYYYDVCDSGKGKSGGNEHCINNFFYYAAPKNLSFGKGTYVRTKEAIGLAQEYALVKDKQKVVCVSTKGNSKKTDTIWCTSIDKKHFYEFKFNNIKETKDDYIKQSLLSAICKLYDTKYTASAAGAATSIGGTAPGYSWPDSCETADKLICANINKSLGRFSYKATIGTSDVPPTGKHSTCVIERVIKDVSNLRTAYSIDNTVFKNVQALAGEDIDNKIKQYVKQELQKQKITFNEKSFYCADSTNVLNGGDVLTCYVNNKPIDFLFKDLSEWSGVNKRGGAQAMDCIVAGGTFDGKRCINLNQKQCEMLRSANLKTCPKCNMAKWDAKNNVCTLPSSAAATNFQKDIKLVGMAAGAVASVAITIATAGTAGLTIGGYVILGVETTGAGLELWSQSKINKLSDEFFLKSNNCYSENCAGQLIETYLTDLAAIDRDLTADEADAVDKEMARLVELIPTNSNWWIDKLRNEDGTSFLEKADNGHWTAAQVWRAVGIGMQFAGIVSSVTGWIIKKTGYLEKTLDRTSKILLKNARIAEKNIVKFENLSDVDKEFWKLWQEYAPKNQTFEQFKAMTNGNLDEMKEMAKNWVSRKESTERLRQIYSQLEENRNQHLEFNELMDKYDIDAMPTDPVELQDLYRQHPDIELYYKDLQSQNAKISALEAERDALLAGNYSTYNPTFSEVFEPQKKIDALRQKMSELLEERKRFETLPWTRPGGGTTETDIIDQQVKEIQAEINILQQQVPTQWQIAEDFPLANLGNVVNERTDIFEKIIQNNSKLKTAIEPDNWKQLSLDERTDIVKQIIDAYTQETGIPSVNRVIIKSDLPDHIGGEYDGMGNNINFNPRAQISGTPDQMLEISSHEHNHHIDLWTPNEGASGEQYEYYASKIYSPEKNNGYRVAFTEQASYKIGPNVSQKVTGTTGFAGKENDLEKAKKIMAGESVNNGISYGVAGGSVATGANMGITKQILENKQKKNVFEKYNDVKKEKK